MSETIMQQVLKLEKMPLAELKKLYKQLYRAEAPDYASCELLKPRIAYRMQELAFGGLSDRAVTALGNINKGKMPVPPPSRKIGILAGTWIVKEWKGNVYKVLVGEKDFHFNGVPYNSLSAVAKKITGTHWSGNRFFGIKEKSDAE